MYLQMFGFKTEVMEFERDVELDAQLVYAGMKGGGAGIADFAFTRRDVFTTPNMAMDRCLWIKAQDEEYVNQVCLRSAEIEAEKEGK